MIAWLLACAGPGAQVAPPPPVEAEVRGTVVWTRTLPGPVEGVVADAGGVVAWTAFGVDALDAGGRQRWARAGGLVPAAGGLAVTGGAVVRLGADGSTADPAPLGGTLVGPVVAAEGYRAWSLAEGLVGTDAGWSLVVGATPVGPPATDAGRVHVAAADRVVAGGADGRAWVVEVPMPLSGGPVLGPDAVYVPFGPAGSEPGGVLALGRDGAERWRAWTRDLPVGVAVDAYVYVSDRDGRVYALDPASGRWRWEMEGFGPFTTAPLVVGRAVYAGAADGRVWAMDAWDGGVLWSRALGAAVTAGPTAVDGRVVVGLADGRVVALGG